MFQEMEIMPVGGMMIGDRSLHPATDALFMAQEGESLTCNDELDQLREAVPYSIVPPSFQESNEKWSSDVETFNDKEDIFPKIEWCFQNQLRKASAAKTLKSPCIKQTRRPKWNHDMKSQSSHVGKANYSYQMLRSKSFGSGLCFLVPSSSSATNLRIKSKNLERYSCCIQSSQNETPQLFIPL